MSVYQQAPQLSTETHPNRSRYRIMRAAPTDHTLDGRSKSDHYLSPRLVKAGDRSQRDRLIRAFQSEHLLPENHPHPAYILASDAWAELVCEFASNVDSHGLTSLYYDCEDDAEPPVDLSKLFTETGIDGIPNLATSPTIHSESGTYITWFTRKLRCGHSPGFEMTMTYQDRPPSTRRDNDEL